MKTLQEFLNQEYPTQSDKEQVKKLATNEIQKQREQQGISELLEGGELDLKEYINIEEVIVDQSSLQTPLTKINTGGLVHLKEIIWNSQPTPDLSKQNESEEEKKLWEDLGIADENEENINKKNLIREITRLGELFTTEKLTNKKINFYFGTDKEQKEQLKDQDGKTETNDEGFDVYLQLERKDKKGDFCPNLVLWTLTQELTSTIFTNYDKNPIFWQHFWDEEQGILKWVKENLTEIYQQELELLVNPTTFPHELLEIKDFWQIYFPNAKDNDKFSQSIVSEEILIKTWKIIREELIKLLDQEFQTDPIEENAEKLATKATVICGPSSQEYIIQVNYSSQSPLKEQIEQLLISTPMKLEIENLKQKQEQLPTSENFEKVIKQKKELENCLKDYLDEDTYQKIMKKINQIK